MFHETQRDPYGEREAHKFLAWVEVHLCHGPDRLPDSYALSRRFATNPFEDMGADDRHQFSKTCIDHRRLAYGLAWALEDVMAKKDLPPADDRLRHHIMSVKGQDEEVADQRRSC